MVYMFDNIIKGGPTSGNFGHAGVKGKKGGSAPGGGHSKIGGRDKVSEHRASKTTDKSKITNKVPDVKYNKPKVMSNQELFEATAGTSPFGSAQRLRDRQLERVASMTGAAKKPHIASDEQVVEYAQANGQPVLYRGYSTREGAESFRSGEYYGGLGISMNGTYTTTAEVTAQHYARRYTSEDKGKGSVGKMTLHKDSKIVDTDSEEFYQLKKDYAQNIGTSTMGLGTYLTGKGIDAVSSKPSSESSEKYYIILNRGAVIVSKEDY
jgi:ribosomal protein L44E